MTQRLCLLALILTVTLLPAAAQAAPITFNLENLNATNNTPNGISTLTLTTPDGITITITRENGDVFDVFQPGGFPASFGNRVLSPFRGTLTNAYLVELSQPTYFFGVDFLDLGTDIDTMTIEAYSQHGQVGLITSQTSPGYTIVPSTATFSIGGPTPALSLRFIGGSTDPVQGPPVGGGRASTYADNLTFDFAAPIQPVPEPASLALLASGLAGAAFRRRRQR